MILPGRIHNPIFIYGAIGVGKTHLLQAVAQEYKKESRIRYVAAEQLVNDVVQSIQSYGYNDVTEQCLNLDVLLVDDIHLMKDKKFTLEELLRIFKRLYDARKQVVITADRPVTQIFKTKGGAARIFQKGISLKLEPPDYNERLRFLRTKARATGISLRDGIFEDLAHRIRPDFRELKGALAKAAFIL